MRYGLRVGDDGTRSAEEVMALTRAQGFGAEVKRRIMLGTYALSSGYYDAYYGKAQQVRTLIIRDFEAAFERVDVLVSPTTPTTAFPLGRAGRRPDGHVPGRPVHDPVGPVGQRGAVGAVRARAGGRPAGRLQVMAPVLADDRMYRVAPRSRRPWTPAAVIRC